MSALAQSRLPTPQVSLTSTPPPKYQNPPPTPWTPTQNKMPLNSHPRSSLNNPFQTTPNTSRAPFASPVVAMNNTPVGRAHESACDPLTNWDQCIPYPKTTEGKAAYEAAMQAW